MFAMGVAVLVVVAIIVTVVMVTEAPVSRKDATADGSRSIGRSPRLRATTKWVEVLWRIAGAMLRARYAGCQQQVSNQRVLATGLRSVL